MLLVQALYGEVAGIDSFGDPPLRCSKRLFANANLETAKRVRSAQNLDRLDNKNENRRQNPSGYSFEAAELEFEPGAFCLERGKPSRDRRNRKARHVSAGEAEVELESRQGRHTLPTVSQPSISTTRSAAGCRTAAGHDLTSTGP